MRFTAYMRAYCFYTKATNFLVFCGFFKKRKASGVSLGSRGQGYELNIFENGRKGQQVRTHSACFHWSGEDWVTFWDLSESTPLLTGSRNWFDKLDWYLNLVCSFLFLIWPVGSGTNTIKDRKNIAHILFKIISLIRIYSKA